MTNAESQKSNITPWQQTWIRILSTALAAGLMIGIFIFSHQGKWESEKSSEPLAQVMVSTGVVQAVQSDKVRQVIEPVIHTDEELPIEQQAQQLARKLGHILLFGALGFCLRICLESWFSGRRFLTLWSLLIGILYGASDELHQSFVPARSAEVHDVFVDAIGVVLGVFLALFLMRLVKKRASRGSAIQSAIQPEGVGNQP